MKEREPLPAWVAEEQRKSQQMDAVMAKLEYLDKRHALDDSEVCEIIKAEMRIREQIDKAEQLMREKVKKELSGI